MQYQLMVYKENFRWFIWCLYQVCISLKILKMIDPPIINLINKKHRPIEQNRKSVFNKSVKKKICIFIRILTCCYILIGAVIGKLSLEATSIIMTVKSDYYFVYFLFSKNPYVFYILKTADSFGTHYSKASTLISKVV